MPIAIALLNEFNALHYWRKDTQAVRFRQEQALLPPHKPILSKKHGSVVLSPYKTLEFLTITLKIELALVDQKRLQQLQN
jgi:hypothetical protein